MTEQRRSCGGIRCLGAGGRNWDTDDFPFRIDMIRINRKGWGDLMGRSVCQEGPPSPWSVERGGQDWTPAQARRAPVLLGLEADPRATSSWMASLIGVTWGSRTRKPWVWGVWAAGQPGIWALSSAPTEGSVLQDHAGPKPVFPMFPFHLPFGTEKQGHLYWVIDSQFKAWGSPCKRNTSCLSYSLKNRTKQKTKECGFISPKLANILYCNVS